MSELHVKIGKLLKLERGRQSITLDDLSTKLKISVGNLKQIEAGNLDGLPSELYFNLFAKSYAEALGINYAATVEAIKEDIGQPLEPEGAGNNEKRDHTAETATAADEQPAPPARRSAPRTKLLRNVALLLGIIIVLFIILVLVNKLFLSKDDGKSGLDMPTDAASTDISAEKRLTADEVDFAAYDWSIPHYKKPSDLQLKLTARQNSWATVLCDGDTAIFRTLVPGKVYTVSAQHHLQVSVAVPSLVDAELNGRSVDLRNPATGTVSRVVIDQANLDSILRPTDSDTDITNIPSASVSDSKVPVQTSFGQDSNLVTWDSRGTDKDKLGNDSAGTDESESREP